MKKSCFYLVFTLCILMFNFVQADIIDDFNNVTEKTGRVIVVEKGSIVEYIKDGAKLLVDNSQIAYVEGKKIKIIDSGRFNVIVEMSGSKTTFEFFAWNAYLKSGRFYAYNDIKRASKAEVLYSETYLKVSEINNDVFVVDDYVFSTGEYNGELKGKYITSYYDKTKDASASKYYDYAMKSDFKMPEQLSSDQLTQGSIEQSTPSKPSTGSANHEHKYEELIKVKQEATCNTRGINVYKCTMCSETKEIKVDKLSHTYVLRSKDTTKHEQVCELCGKIAFTSRHDLNSVGNCVCGYSKNGNISEQPGSSGGSEEIQDKPEQENDKHKHKYEEFVEVKLESTCNSEGINVFKCTQCDLTKEVKISKLEHSFEELVKVKKEATCNSRGINIYKCTQCDKTKEEKVAKLEHVYVMKYKDNKNHQRVCSLCQKVNYTAKHSFKNDDICECGYIFHEHKFEKLIEEKQVATCNSKGIKIFQCNECNETKKVEEPKLEHVYELKNYSKSQHQKVCTLCNKSTSKQSHKFNDEGKCECGYAKHVCKFDELVSEQAATCKKTGKAIYKCSECGKKQEVKKEQLEHSYEIKSKDSKNHQQVCTICGTTKNIQKHVFDDGKCVCGYVEESTSSTHSTKKDMKKLQEKLKELGYYTDKIDGFWGKNTRNAIINVLNDYNFGRNIKSTAKWSDVDIDMYNFIINISKQSEEPVQPQEPQQPLQPSEPVDYTFNLDFIDDRKALQTCLKDLRYYSGSIDGDIGTKTIKSLNEVLSDYGFVGKTNISNMNEINDEIYNFIMNIPKIKVYVKPADKETGIWKQKILMYEDKYRAEKINAVIIYLHGVDNDGESMHPSVYKKLNMPNDVVLVCPILADKNGSFADYNGAAKMEKLLDEVSKEYPDAVIILEGHSKATKFVGSQVEKNNPRIDGYGIYSPNWFDIEIANDRNNVFVTIADKELESFYERLLKTVINNPSKNNVSVKAPKEIAKTHGQCPQMITTEVHWNWVRNIINNKAK